MDSVEYAILTCMIDDIHSSLENDSYLSKGDLDDIQAYVDLLERFITAYWPKFVNFVQVDRGI